MSAFFLGGDDTQAAHVYYYDAVASAGPGVSDLHPDEMGRQELIDHMVYMGIAALDARKDGKVEIAQILHDWYDELFVRVAEVDEGFRNRIKAGRIRPMKAGYERNMGYYLELAGIA